MQKKVINIDRCAYLEALDVLEDGTKKSAREGAFFSLCVLRLERYGIAECIVSDTLANEVETTVNNHLLALCFGVSNDLL